MFYWEGTLGGMVLDRDHRGSYADRMGGVVKGEAVEVLETFKAVTAG